MKMKAIPRLVRYENVFLVALSVVLAQRFDGDLLSSIRCLLLFIAAACILAGANVINDLSDVARDSLSDKKNPVANGDISEKAAFIIGWILTIIGAAAAALSSVEHLAIAMLAAFLLLLYNIRFKNTPLLGNIIVATASALLFVFFGIGSSRTPLFITAALFAFLTHLAREIFKDIEDAPADSAVGAKTLPIAVGDYVAFRTAGVVAAIVALLIPIPFIIGQFSLLYLVVAAVAVLPFIIMVIILAFRRKDAHKAQVFMKLIMLGGMIAMYAGVR